MCRSSDCEKKARTLLKASAEDANVTSFHITTPAIKTIRFEALGFLDNYKLTTVRKLVIFKRILLNKIYIEDRGQKKLIKIF